MLRKHFCRLEHQTDKESLVPTNILFFFVGDGLARPAGLARTHKNFINKIFKFIETIYTNQLILSLLKHQKDKASLVPTNILFFIGDGLAHPVKNLRHIECIFVNEKFADKASHVPTNHYISYISKLSGLSLSNSQLNGFCSIYLLIKYNSFSSLIILS
jgi:hypothetical protein